MGKHEELTLKVQGMHCASCVANIERGVSGLDGVSECRVNLATNTAVVEFDAGRLDPPGIIQKIKSLGYGATVGQQDVLSANETELRGAKNRFLLALLLAIPLMAIAMWPMITTRSPIPTTVSIWLQAVLAGVIVFWAGRGILMDAGRQAIHFRANMNTLIAMGAVVSYGWSLYEALTQHAGHAHAIYFESAGMIVTLILLGRYLEARSKGRAGEAIAALMKLRPARTTAIINGVEIELEAAAAQPGMILLVKPGERVAADGVIVEGEASLDESVLTGESMPQDKSVGARVIGGSLNGNKPFRMKVEASGDQSFLSNVIRLVSEAQSKKAPVQKLADKIAGVFVPLVILLAGITWLVWYLLAPGSPLIFPSVIAVLIISCPCALGLATPTAVLAGTGRAARAGIIIRGGDILETLSKVDALVLDKTGTLTHGELTVVDVRAVDGFSISDLIRIAGAVERQSEHPVAQAIAARSGGEGSAASRVEGIEAKPGFGMVALVDNRPVVIGNRALMDARQLDLNGTLELAEPEMELGRTVVYVAVEGRVRGIFSVADRVRGEAKEVVAQLRSQIPYIAMVTGDNRKAAAEIAESVGIENCESEVRPEQKTLFVESYRRAGHTVAMVGDGINDAPALAAANVGVAIGGGTDIAMEAADVVLVRPDLNNLRRMFAAARKTMAIIRQNLFWAFFYNVIAIPLAAGAFYPAFGIRLSPMIAAAAMAMSSVFVVSNSLRLSRLELD